ncbi:MAG: hypothetical protein COV74_07905 [Candidatus Omnitrophica bacterium CG11_big_fil_rev_8_21_14_0_20_45_26]|uniref:TonB C-terminal domain-containing protein n=1 Tax=Candidatus Abzuiibacterium crystallinum TaxID=1974748 RepID=A0A2H0LPK6_9BACT|nr:MAG: hypothetical protein COV74_07905 [Candidatus Omnitrophica bacterium CG11_big_fil_rev_8_21_14_0_20_45_26]PIW65145.1 MAG: hypothetical protein COW12_02945 [Candidatus Omnitrophica bacterium CG12_big_fil_rev_8_21_14_0_65_45_16]
MNFKHLCFISLYLAWFGIGFFLPKLTMAIVFASEGQAVSNTFVEAVVMSDEQRRYFDPLPVYPTISRRTGEEGRVVIEFTILPNGNTANQYIVQSSGHDHLDQAALAASQKWHFDPVQIDGHAISSTRRIPIEFKLKN